MKYMYILSNLSHMHDINNHHSSSIGSVKFKINPQQIIGTQAGVAQFYKNPFL